MEFRAGHGRAGSQSAGRASGGALGMVCRIHHHLGASRRMGRCSAALSTPLSAGSRRASALADVPADWILGVMRQESLYRKDAVSRADARGLMQMLPATAAA